jgi:hypothetical protein
MMIIQKVGKVNRTIIRAGETIKFRINDDPNIYQKTIEGFEDSSIVFRNYKIHIKEIRMLKAPLHPRISKYSELLIAGGSILFIADQVNNSIVNNEPFTFSRGVTIVSTSMITTGILLRFVKKRKFKFPGPHKILLI